METEVVHMYQHDENTEARSQTRALTTLRLGTYSHYSDEPNKEMHSFIYTTACYTYSTWTQEQTKLTRNYA